MRRAEWPIRTSIGFRRGYTVRDLAVTLTGLLVAAGLLASLAGAKRDLSQAAVCAGNLKQLFDGLTSYVNQYNSFPPHNPYPQAWWPAGATQMQVNGLTLGGWDPNIGWILTYGLGLEPPERFANGHFKWFGLTWEQLPGVVKCPALRPGLLDPDDPEIDEYSPLESLVYIYALSYQTSGTCRSATPVIRVRQGGSPGLGGRNSPIPDPRFGYSTAQQVDNANGGIPYVWAWQHSGAPDAPTYGGSEHSCWVQAVGPSEVQSPARTYFYADTRDYRPRPAEDQYSWPPAGINDGWLGGWGNKILLGTRHYGYANALYLDGHVSRDNQWHYIAHWNMDYDPVTGIARSNEWRCGTFRTDVELAGIRSQVHIMPVLMVRGWEYFFDEDGVAPR